MKRHKIGFNNVLKTAFIISFGVLVAVLLPKAAHAANLWWVGAAGGNFSVASNWKTTNPLACGGGDAGAAPGSADTAIFDADCDNSATVDGGATINNLDMQAGYAGTVTLGGALTVNDDLTLTAGTLDVSASLFGITVGGSWTDTGAGAFTERTGTVTFTGAVASPTINSNEPFYNVTIAGTTFQVDLGAALDVDGTLTLSSGTFSAVGFGINVAVDWSAPGGTFDAGPGGNTVTFDGTGAQTINSTVRFWNVDINKSGGTTTLAADLDMNSALTLTAGTLDVSASNFTIRVASWTDTGAGSFTERTGRVAIWAVATVNANEAFFDVDIQPGAGITVTLGNTLDVNGTLTLTSGTLDVSASNFEVTVGVDWTDTGAGVFGEQTGKVTFDGTGAQTINANEAFSSMTINKSGGTVTLGNTLDVNGTLTLTSGTLDVSVSLFAITVGGGWTDTGAGAFTERTGTVTFNGSAAQTINANEAFYNVEINKSAGTATLGAALDVDGTLTLTAGTLDVDAINNYGITVGGGWTDTGAGVFNEGTGTVTFDGTGTINANERFYSVTINTSGTLTLAAELRLDGTLTVTAGTLALAGFNISDAAGGDTAARGNIAGTIRLFGSETVFWTTNDIDSGTYEYVGDGDGTAENFTIKDFGATDYYNLTINDTNATKDTFVLGAALDVDNNLTISAGTLDASASNFNINLAGNWSNSTGSFTPRSGTVILDGSGNQTMTTGGSGTGKKFYNLTINKSGGTASVTGDLDVDNNFTITAGSFTAPPGTMYVGANFSNSGTFTHNSGTVNLDGGNQTLTGSTTFNNLTKTVSTARTLTFPAGATQTITGTLTLQGASGAVLSLRSSSDGTQWRIDPQGTRTLSYLDVKDSNNINATTILAGSTITNSGNNTGWIFIPAAPSGFKGTAQSSTSIKWEWTDNSNNEDGFRIQDGNGNTIATVGANVTSYTETGLTKGTSYTRRVVAFNAAGESSATANVTVTTNANPPTTPTFKSPSDKAILNTLKPTITFTRSTDADDGLKEYTLIFDDGTGNAKSLTFADPGANTTTTYSQFTVTATADEITVTITDSSLLSEGNHTVKIRAKDKGENTADSGTITITLDLTNPTLGTVSISPAETGTKADLITKSQSPEVTLSLSDSVGLKEVTVTLEKKIFLLGQEIGREKVSEKTFALSGTSQSISFAPGALEFGEYVLTIVIKDAAGNKSTSTKTLVILSPVQTTIAQVKKAIEAGKVPTKTPEALTLPELEKAARIRRQREAANLREFLAKFLPIAWLGKIDQAIASSVSISKNQLLARLKIAKRRMAGIFGFSRDEIADLASLIELQRRKVALQRAQLPASGQIAEVIGQRRDELLSELDLGLPRLTGKLVVFWQDLFDRTNRIIAQARENRLALALVSEQKVSQSIQPVVRLAKGIGVGARVTLDYTKGEYEKPLNITNVTIAVLQPTKAVITWQTNHVSTGKVNYGTSISYGEEVLFEDFANFHRVELVNLKRGTKYYFEVLSTGLRGSQTYDAFYGFDTPQD